MEKSKNNYNEKLEKNLAELGRVIYQTNNALKFSLAEKLNQKYLKKELKKTKAPWLKLTWVAVPAFMFLFVIFAEAAEYAGLDIKPYQYLKKAAPAIATRQIKQVTENITKEIKKTTGLVKEGLVKKPAKLEDQKTENIVPPTEISTKTAIIQDDKTDDKTIVKPLKQNSNSTNDQKKSDKIAQSALIKSQPDPLTSEKTAAANQCQNSLAITFYPDDLEKPTEMLKNSLIKLNLEIMEFYNYADSVAIKLNLTYNQYYEIKALLDEVNQSKISFKESYFKYNVDCGEKIKTMFYLKKNTLTSNPPEKQIM